MRRVSGIWRNIAAKSWRSCGNSAAFFREPVVKLSFEEFTLAWDSRQLLRAGSPVHVSPKALELLKLLLDNRPRALSKASLHQELWPSTFVSDATLTSLVAELRASLDDRAQRPRFVRTVHRFGYAFSGSVTEVPESGEGHRKGAVSYWITWDTGQVPLREGRNILGRGRDVAVWLESIDVSRHHARISICTDEAILEDLGSRNGTYLRGERITSPRQLADGDAIGLGSVVVIFRTSSAEASTRSQILPRPIAAR